MTSNRFVTGGWAQLEKGWVFRGLEVFAEFRVWDALWPATWEVGHLSQTWYVLCPLVDSEGSSNEVVDVAAFAHEDWVDESVNHKSPSATVILIGSKVPVFLKQTWQENTVCIQTRVVIVLGCYWSHWVYICVHVYIIEVLGWTILQRRIAEDQSTVWSRNTTLCEGEIGTPQCDSIYSYNNEEDTVRARYTTRCEGESGTVWVRRQTQCERIKILVVWRTDTSTRRRHVELVEVTKRTVNGVPPERKPLLYRLMCTQSYSPVRRNHWVYICIYISCVSRECEYSFHLSLCNVYLENERVYSFLVSLENECVYLFHVHLSTHWSLSVKTSRIFVSTGQLYFLVVSLWCTDRTPNVGGWYPFGVYKLTKEDTTQLQV